MKRTGRLLEIPVGEQLLGRLVDPLGRPLDDKGEINTTESRPPSTRPRRRPPPAGGGADADGLKAIDSMIPIGRGQRELIIGDRQTGKTAIAIDTIINNRSSDLVCIYVAIGQRMSTVVQVMETWRRPARWRTRSSSPLPPTRRRRSSTWRPTRVRDGEHFLYQGKHALCIYDDPRARRRLPADVTAPAAPPGREAYPGDVFYLHSRLLERAVKLRRAGRRLAHRPAGDRDPGGRHLRLHPHERHLDHRRADLPGDGSLLLGGAAGDQRRHLRIEGGNAQTKAMKKVAGKPRPLAVPRARGVRPVRLRARSRDPAPAGPRRANGRGAQPVRAQPMNVAEQVASIFAGTAGHLDRIKTERVADFLEDLLARLRAENKDLLDRSTRPASSPTRTSKPSAIRSVRWSTTSAPTSTRRATLWRRASPTGSSRRPSVPPPVPGASPGRTEPERGRARGGGATAWARRLHRHGTRKEVKNRISSVKNVQKITRAMEMVAAAGSAAPSSGSTPCGPTPASFAR